MTKKDKEYIRKLKAEGALETRYFIAGKNEVSDSQFISHFRKLLKNFKGVEISRFAPLDLRGRGAPPKGRLIKK